MFMSRFIYSEELIGFVFIKEDKKCENLLFLKIVYNLFYGVLVKFG